MNTLNTQHLLSLCKYTGISFIAGSVTHGAFSGQRSFITAGLGVALFVASVLFERRQASAGDSSNWLAAIALGIVAAIGLGLFTGGVQHFPDSPSRSAWVVPLGFALSFIALVWGARPKLALRKKLWVYGLAGTAVVALLSFGLAKYLGEGAGHDHGAHSHGDVPKASHGVPPATGNQLASPSTLREIRLSVDDTMRFTPEHWEAKAGETVRIVLVNAGKLPHELVIGDKAEVESHAKEMSNPKNAHSHAHTNVLSVAPGQTAQTNYTFTQAGDFTMGCLVAGHFEAGMRGMIHVRG